MKNHYAHTLLSAFYRSSNIINIIAQRIKWQPFFCLAILVPALCAGQQAGDLDITFSSDGKQTTAIGSNDYGGNSVAIQADGKIVVAGVSNGGNHDFAIVRYNSDGSLDNSFSGDGQQTTAIGSSSDYGMSVAIQFDGKILIAGFSYNGTNNDFAIVRYNSDGSLDNSFSGDGKQTTAFGNGWDFGTSVAIQSDGKIIVAGMSENGTLNYDFALVRYNSDGSLDNSFSGDGKQTTPIGSGLDRCNSVAIQADGKIVLAGYSNNGANNDFALVRYNNDGSLDNSFSGDGKQTTAIGSGTDEGSSVAIQSDGKIIVAGFSDNGTNRDFALVRYNSDGSLDNSFSGDGKQTTVVGSSSGGKSVAIQADGKIIVAGYSGTGSDFALVCYYSDGSLDNSFSGDGKQTTDIGSSFDYGNSVAIQSDGKIVVAGESYNGSTRDFAIARYLGASGTGIDDNISFDFISTSVFPNPFQHTATLKVFGATEINSTLSIYNSLGQIVHAQIISSTETVLHLELSGGIYSYTISNETGKLSARGKFAIQ